MIWSEVFADGNSCGGNGCYLPRVGSPRDLADDVTAIGIVAVGRRWQGRHRERFARQAVDQEASVGRVLRQVREVVQLELAVVLAELLSELLSELLGVVTADLEAHDRTDVAEDGTRGVVIELAEVLMSDRQTQTVLASFAQDGGKAARREVLELVDAEEEVAALCFGDVGSRESGLLQGCHQ